jgi:hypothetical protein
MNALYTVEDKGTYKEVEFTEDGQTQIRELYNKKQDPPVSGDQASGRVVPGDERMGHPCAKERDISDTGGIKTRLYWQLTCIKHTS